MSVFKKDCPVRTRKLLEPLVEMLIKPRLFDRVNEEDKSKGRIKSLPSNKSKDSQTRNQAYFGAPDELNESLEIEGRLLMLPIMYEEWNLKQNKIIHDTSGCIRPWMTCDCRFAKTIRMKDIGGKNWTLNW